MRMNYRVLFGAATLAFGLVGHAAHAQSSGVPAEFPPASFDGNQFVDSDGCAFIRAGVGGAVTWVPRVDRRRNQLCSFQATFAQAAPVPAPAAPAPAPAPRRNVGAPIQTVASVTTAPRLVQIPTASTPTARSPQIVRAAPRVAPVAAPVPVAAPAPVVQAPAPLQTRAALCVGRTGLQPGFVSSTTGLTIDCGGVAPVRAAAVIAPVAAAPLRMTMAQVCADMRSTGRNFINAATGAPVRCGPQTQPLTAFAPARPAAPSVPSATPRVFAQANCPATLLSVEGQEVRCGPQTQPITTRTTTFSVDAQVTRSTVSTSTAPLFGFGEVPVPASNPVGVSQREVLPVPKGYSRVWKDGRHNPNRGLPRAAATVAPALDASVSTRTAPVANAHRYVQVGTFANAGNAQALGQRFMGMGLPVGLATTSRGKVVVLGPFSSASGLNRGLNAARGAGFGDAYTRN